MILRINYKIERLISDPKRSKREVIYQFHADLHTERRGELIEILGELCSLSGRLFKPRHYSQEDSTARCIKNLIL